MWERKGKEGRGSQEGREDREVSGQRREKEAVSHGHQGHHLDPTNTGLCAHSRKQDAGNQTGLMVNNLKAGLHPGDLPVFTVSKHTPQDN